MRQKREQHEHHEHVLSSLEATTSAIETWQGKRTTAEAAVTNLQQQEAEGQATRDRLLLQQLEGGPDVGTALVECDAMLALIRGHRAHHEASLPLIDRQLATLVEQQRRLEHEASVVALERLMAERLRTVRAVQEAAGSFVTAVLDYDRSVTEACAHARQHGLAGVDVLQRNPVLGSLLPKNVQSLRVSFEKTAAELVAYEEGVHREVATRVRATAAPIATETAAA